MGLGIYAYPLSLGGFVLYRCNPYNWNNALSKIHFSQKCSPDESLSSCVYIYTHIERQCGWL